MSAYYILIHTRSSITVPCRQFSFKSILVRPPSDVTIRAGNRVNVETYTVTSGFHCRRNYIHKRKLIYLAQMHAHCHVDVHVLVGEIINVCRTLGGNTECSRKFCLMRWTASTFYNNPDWHKYVTAHCRSNQRGCRRFKRLKAISRCQGQQRYHQLSWLFS